MTTDFENELRNLFREKAAEAPLATPTMPASAPPQVLRRGRLHQVGTVLGSVVVVVALIVGSVAGLTRVLGEGQDDQVGNGDYEVFQRTATIESFTVTSPSDWYLVNEWPLSGVIAVEGSGGSSSACVAVPGGAIQECEDTPGSTTSSPIPVHHGLPMLQLSNVDLGLTTNACAEGLPGDGAALYVALDYDAEIAGVADPSIQEFPPDNGLPPEGDGPCGRGAYSHFTVNGHPMFAWVGVGSDVSAEDRAIVQTSYQMMSAIPDWEPIQPERAFPTYVIAGGAAEDGESWRLDLLPDGPSPELLLQGTDPATARDPSPGTLIDRYYSGELTDPIFGTVTRAATGVEFRPGTENSYLDLGQSPVAGTIVPVPPSLGAFDFDLFFIDLPEGYADLSGHVIALGVDEPSTTPSPSAEHRADTVDLSGSLLGQDWNARFTGAFSDESACIRVRIKEPNEPLCLRQLDTSLAGPQPSMHIWVADELAVLAGSVPPEVLEIRFRSDDGSTVPMEVQCLMGPLGWTDPDKKVCAVALPPEGSGTVEYLDADGNVLFEDGMGWGRAEPESSEYAWTNEDSVITARGSFRGADWKLEVLHYLEGYRLTIDSRVVFQGRPFGLAEAEAFPLFEGDRADHDALVFVLTTGDETRASIVTADRTWEGRWIPGSTVSGGKGRLWVFEMPGSGTGSYWLDGDSLQGEVSWP